MKLHLMVECRQSISAVHIVGISTTMASYHMKINRACHCDSGESYRYCFPIKIRTGQVTQLLHLLSERIPTV